MFIGTCCFMCSCYACSRSNWGTWNLTRKQERHPPIRIPSMKVPDHQSAAYFLQVQVQCNWWSFVHRWQCLFEALVSLKNISTLCWCQLSIPGPCFPIFDSSIHHSSLLRDLVRLQVIDHSMSSQSGFVWLCYWFLGDQMFLWLSQSHDMPSPFSYGKFRTGLEIDSHHSL